jgi:hypothetical protein
MRNCGGTMVQKQGNRLPANHWCRTCIDNFRHHGWERYPARLHDARSLSRTTALSASRPRHQRPESKIKETERSTEKLCTPVSNHNNRRRSAPSSNRDRYPTRTLVAQQPTRRARSSAGGIIQRAQTTAEVAGR